MERTVYAIAVMLLTLVCGVVATTSAGEKFSGTIQPSKFAGLPAQRNPSVKLVHDSRAGRISPGSVGVYTGLGGFYDYQCNGGAAQHVRINPANGNIHVIFMVADDSLDFSAGLRTAYAFSSNNGASWNSFGAIRVPARRAAFPTLDLVPREGGRVPVIANHNDPGSGLRSMVYVDSSEGAGRFFELNSAPELGDDDEPIWPFVVSGSDGSVNYLASRLVATTAHYTRTTNFADWTAYMMWPSGGDNGGFSSAASNSNGRIGYLMNYVTGGAEWLESTDNGATWPVTPLRIHDAIRVAGPDTFQVWTGCDVVYDGDVPYLAFAERNVGANDPTDGSQIVFWSEATGYIVVATRATTPGVATNLNVAQVNHSTMGYPAIGISGSKIFIAWVGFTSDTSSSGFNYGDIFYSQSNDGGVSWSPAVNLTNTASLDERYPSVSKWNPAGTMNLTWQEDPEPGTFSVAIPDNGNVARVRQVFLRLTLTRIEASRRGPEAFVLEQNYPNPFNPSTTIEYTVGEAGPVTIKMYNTLGQEVATVLNANRAPGQYEVIFDGAHLPSGVYIYKMTAGNYHASKKMVLMK